MKFEIHKCTINHLKTKSNKHETAEDVETQDFDFAEFKTVDSIGDVDGEEGLTCMHLANFEINI